MTDKGMGILLIFVAMALVLVSAFALNAETRARDYKIELMRANLDKAGLNGLCKSLIEQKFAPPNYNTLDYAVNLPDNMTVAIKVNYLKNHILSPKQGHELVRLHKEAIAEITLEEWTSYRDFKPLKEVGLKDFDDPNEKANLLLHKIQHQALKDNPPE